MANIHGMGDFNNRNDNDRQQRQQMMGGMGQGNADEQPDFIRGIFRQQDMSADPRKETFLQMLQQTFCPTLTKTSFVTLITLVESGCFLAQTIGSFIAGGPDTEYFLGCNPTVLDYFNRSPTKIVNKYQIYRLLTAIFIHTGFSHWIMNMITQLIFGSWLEAMVGFRFTAMTYFVSGILANVFASVTNFTDSAVGASTAICGLIAGQLAMIIVNWSQFSGNPQLEQMRCCFVAMSVIMLVMMVVMSGSMKQTDILGHLGGAIFGFLFGMAMYPRPATETGKKCRMFGFGTFTLTAVLLIGLLFGIPSFHNE